MLFQKYLVLQKNQIDFFISNTKLLNKNYKVKFVGMLA